MKSEGLKQSQAHERRLAKKVGGSTVAASGAFWSRKGDVRSPDLLIEHKYTGNKSFTLKASVLDKIEKEAIMDGRMPYLGISLGNRNWCMITEDDFMELREKALGQSGTGEESS